MAVGREQIRDWAIGIEMDGLDGWHYDYQAHGDRRARRRWWSASGSSGPGIIDDATGQEYEILGIGGSWFGVERQADGPTTAAEVRLAARLVRPRRRRRTRSSRSSRPGKAPRGAARPDVGRRPRACPATTSYEDLPSTRLAAAGRGAATTSPRSRPGGDRHDDLPAAAQLLIDGKLVPAQRRRDVPDPQPGHRRGDRPGARRHRRRRRRRDRRGPAGLRRDRLVDRRRAAGPLPAPAAPGAARPRRRRSRR